eukprot:CAMPEP_0184869184 /NCGR_PEP_ID=MMETSP0580-20130426/33255_1 /TAXON_ID=1118495 /ORGANISM="Dactyliosolen fragilissimus" /LENGTH=528 /DNA_ID=CAMNT_0027370507 /DNA_START=350 /DNA_END=1933 /DNA_ORIENTATION=+
MGLKSIRRKLSSQDLSYLRMTKPTKRDNICLNLHQYEVIPSTQSKITGSSNHNQIIHQHHHHKVYVSASPSNDPELLSTAINISAQMSLPFYAEGNETFYVFDDGNNRENIHNNHDNDDKAVEMKKHEPTFPFTHRLVIIPYQHDNMQSYALAIQAIQNEKNNKNKNNRKRREKKKHKEEEYSDSIPNLSPTSSWLSFTSQPFFIDLIPSSDTRLGKRMAGNNKNKRSGIKMNGGTTGGGNADEMLLRAVTPSKLGNTNVNARKGNGVRAGDGAKIYDLTAGYGQDGAILALGGASSVHLVERNPIVAALLRDALRRLSIFAFGNDTHRHDKDQGESSNHDNYNNDHKDDDHAYEKNLAAELARKLTLVEGDGLDLTKSMLADMQSGTFDINDRPHICYLDPMFPTRTKKAAVKKNMQILHGLLQSNVHHMKNNHSNDGDNREKSHLKKSQGNNKTQNDIDQFEIEKSKRERELLLNALNLATNRVVVKRPIHAPILGKTGLDDENVPKPSHQIKGSVNRFDVYISSP